MTDGNSRGRLGTETAAAFENTLVGRNIPVARAYRSYAVPNSPRMFFAPRKAVVDDAEDRPHHKRGKRGPLGRHSGSARAPQRAWGAQSRTPYSEDEQMNDLLALPADRFPSIHQVIETGQVLRGYDEVIDFAVEAIIARVDDSLGH